MKNANYTVIQTMKKIYRRVKGQINDSYYYYIVGRLKSIFIKTKKRKIQDYPVDIVITWVDGNDLKWQKERNKYLSMEKNKAEIEEYNDILSRYREWGFLRYWFRAVEKYAPWARNIFFVTCGHKPDWLNLNNSKIKFVTHEEFIPREYLPTFCSDVIELNLWRIKDLSDHFLYFNDDVYLNRPVGKEDFFENGEPKIVAIAKPLLLRGKIPPWKQRLLNNYAVINDSFNVRTSIKLFPEKWFSYKIKKYTKYNRRVLEDGFITGMLNDHIVMPFLRETFEQLWQDQFLILDKTCRTKLRTSKDVTIYLLTYWMLFQGRFSPVTVSYYGECIPLLVKNINYAVDIIEKSRHISICLNDVEEINSDDIPIISSKIQSAFLRKFPQKSSFEQ